MYTLPSCSLWVLDHSRDRILTTAAQKDLLYNFLFKLKSQLMGSIFSRSLLVEFLQFLETIYLQFRKNCNLAQMKMVMI